MLCWQIAFVGKIVFVDKTVALVRPKPYRSRPLSAYCTTSMSMEPPVGGRCSRNCHTPSAYSNHE